MAIVWELVAALKSSIFFASHGISGLDPGCKVVVPDGLTALESQGWGHVPYRIVGDIVHLSCQAGFRQSGVVLVITV